MTNKQTNQTKSTNQSRKAIANPNTPVPLYDLGTEAEVVTVLLEHDDKLHEVAEVLTVDDFKDPSFRGVYAAMRQLKKANKPIDLALIQQQLDTMTPQVQLTDILESLRASTVTKDSVMFYANYLSKLAYRRRLRAHFQDAIPLIESAEMEVEEVFVKIASGMYELRRKGHEQHLYTAEELLERARQEWQQRKAGIEPEKGVLSGYPSLDAMTKGFRRGELVIIAGNTAHGKTSLAVNILSHMLLFGDEKIAVFSLEMAAHKMFNRLVRGQFREAVQTRDGVEMTDAEWAVVDEALTRLEKKPLPLLIDDTPSIHIDDMRSKMLYLTKEHGVGTIYVDYAQLMQGDGNNRQEEVAHVIRELRAMAKDYDVAVVALAQFNRTDVREQYLRLPKVHNLRESGALEQTADIVLSIMRPEVNIEATSVGGVALKDRAILSVLKNRDGQTKHIDMVFDGGRTLFKELPVDEPSLVQAVLSTGGRPDYGTSSAGVSSTGYASASAGASASSGVSGRNGAASGGQAGDGLPDMSRTHYVDDGLMV